MPRKNSTNVSSRSSATSKVESLIYDSDLANKAFEGYYSLGSQRTLIELESILNVPFEILKQWHDIYAWDERIRERTKELDRAFEQYYKDKTKDIRNRLIGQMENLLSEMESTSLGLPFHIADVNDFRALSQAYESLVRANTLATKQVEATKEDMPTSWSDLLGAIKDESDKRDD